MSTARPSEIVRVETDTLAYPTTSSALLALSRGHTESVLRSDADELVKVMGSYLRILSHKAGLDRMAGCHGGGEGGGGFDCFDVFLC